MNNATKKVQTIDNQLNKVVFKEKRGIFWKIRKYWRLKQVVTKQVQQ